MENRSKMGIASGAVRIFMLLYWNTPLHTLITDFASAYKGQRFKRGATLSA